MNYDPGSSVIPFDETSKGSRVSLTVSNVSENQIDPNSTTSFDYFFSVCDELTRCAPLDYILVLIQTIITSVQWYSTSFFPYLYDTWDFSRPSDKVLRYFTYIADFGCGDPNLFSTTIPSIIIIIVSFLIFIWIFIVIIYFQWNKMFLQYSLTLTRFIFSNLIPIMLFPISYNIGFSFNSMLIDSNSNTTNTFSCESGSCFDSFQSFLNPKDKSFFIFSTLISFIFYLCLLGIFYIDIIFRSSTPYLEDTVFTMWNGSPLFLLIAGNTISIMASRLILGFPEWARCFLLIVYFLFNSFILYQMLYFPLVKPLMNVIISTLVCGTLFSSLFQLFPIPSPFRLFIPLALLFFIFPFFYFYYKRIRKKIGEEPDISTQNRALRTMHVHIAEKCEDFVSWKLIRNITAQIPTTRILARIAQMLSFFPSESQLLNLYVSLLSKRSDLRLNERFIFFQIKRVHVLRQSSSSKQLNADVAEISKSTSRAISCFSQYLIRAIEDRQVMSIDSLSGLASLNRSTNALCREAMEKYPNSSRLLFVYSKYIIECYADYKEGIKLFQKGTMIEHGKCPAVDYAFRAMVNLFPTYLLKRILDYKGKTILNRRRGNRSGSSVSSSTNSNMTDMDFDANEDVTSKVLDQPRLRFALRKAVNNIQFAGVTILTVAAILRFLFSIVICVSIIVISSNFYTTRHDNFENIGQIGEVRKGLDLAIFRMLNYWSAQLGIDANLEEVNKSLGQTWDYQDLATDSAESILGDVAKAISASENLGRLMSLTKLANDENIYDKSEAYLFDQPVTLCSDNATNLFLTYASFRCTSFYIANQIAINANLSAVYPGEPHLWKNNDGLCEVIMNRHRIVSALTTESRVFIEREIAASTDVNNTILLLYGVLIPLTFLLFIVIFAIGYLKMNSEFSYIFNIFKLLPTEIYKEASKPIALFKSDGNDQTKNATQIENQKCKRILIPFTAIVSSIVITVAVSLSIYFVDQSNHKFLVLNRWLEIGARRTPLLLEALINAHYSIIFGYIGPTLYTNSSYHLQQFIDNANDLLNQHHVLIWGSNETTTCNNFDKRLDAIHFDNGCEIDMHGKYAHHAYSCLSLDQLIISFIKFSSDLQQVIRLALEEPYDPSEEFNHNFKDMFRTSVYINYQHLGFVHLFPKLEEAQDILNDGINTQIIELKKVTLIISITALVIELILFVIDVFLLNNLYQICKVVRILVARLPPSAVSNTRSLLELLTNQSMTRSKASSTFATNVRSSSSAIIVIDSNYVIKGLNEVTTSIFGFTREQLYNSNLSRLIENENYQYITNLIDEDVKHRTAVPNKSQKEENELLLVLNNEENKEKESEDKNTTVDLSQSPQSMKITGIKDDNTTIVLESILTYIPSPDNVYCLIMSDETVTFENIKEIEEHKQKLDTFMHQILPPQIVEKVKNNDKNISFIVKFATVISIKILNFDDYIPSISGRQAIRNLSAVFGAFDSIIKEYPNLTKLKILGGVYQAVGGLFNPNATNINGTQAMLQESANINSSGSAGNKITFDKTAKNVKLEGAKSHNLSLSTVSSTPNSAYFKEISLDSIAFAFECLHALEDVNHSIESNLIIAVGIHLGGPISAGTIGDDQLSFDAVGDALKISYKLVQMTENYSVVISNDMFEILKDAEQAQTSLVYSKYEPLKLPGNKLLETYSVNLTAQDETGNPA